MAAPTKMQERIRDRQMRDSAIQREIDAINAETRQRLSAIDDPRDRPGVEAQVAHEREHVYIAAMTGRLALVLRAIDDLNERLDQPFTVRMAESDA